MPIDSGQSLQAVCGTAHFIYIEHHAFSVPIARTPAHSLLGGITRRPVELPELHGAAARPSVKRLRLWHGGINVWTEILTLMSKFGGRTLLSRQKALSLLGAAARQTRRPHGLALRATGRSSLGTARIDLFHPDVYRATAAMSIEAARALPEAGVHYSHRALGAPWHPHALRRQGFTVTLRRT